MGLIKGAFGFLRVEKVVRPMSQLAWAGLYILCVFHYWCDFVMA